MRKKRAKREAAEKKKRWAVNIKIRRSETDKTLIKMHKWGIGGDAVCEKVRFPDVVNSGKMQYNILSHWHRVCGVYIMIFT